MFMTLQIIKFSLMIFWLCFFVLVYHVVKSINNRRRLTFNASPAKSSFLKFVEIYFNPRIALLAIDNCLKKISRRIKRWIVIFNELGWVFLDFITLDFSFGLRVRKEKIKLRLWRNLNSCPRQENKAIIVKSASVFKDIGKPQTRRCAIRLAFQLRSGSFRAWPHASSRGWFSFKSLHHCRIAR